MESKPTQSLHKRPNHKIDLDELRRLSDENPKATLKELGSHFGCNKQAISQAIIRHNIPHQTRRSRTNPAELRKFVEENPYATLNELSKHFKCTNKNICRIVKRNNITYTIKLGRKRMIDPDKLRQLVRDNPNATHKELSKHFGCTGGAISHELKKQQIPYVRKPRREQKIDPERLRQLVRDNPNATHKDLSKHFGCSVSGIGMALKRFGI